MQDKSYVTNTDKYIEYPVNTAIEMVEKTVSKREYFSQLLFHLNDDWGMVSGEEHHNHWNLEVP